MIATETQLYRLGAGVAAVLVLVGAWLAAQYDSNTRTHAGVLVVLLLVLAGGYAGMAGDVLTLRNPSGNPVHFPRYIMNLVTYSFALGYAALVAGASFRLRMLTVAILVVTNGSTAVIQLTDGALSSVFTLVSLVSLVAAIWVFFRPLTRASGGVSEERALLFKKLRNLTVLAYLTYTLISIVARGGAGLLDDFTSVFVTGYTDFIVVAGLVFIALQSRIALKHMAAAHNSPLDIFVPRA